MERHAEARGDAKALRERSVWKSASAAQTALRLLRKLPDRRQVFIANGHENKRLKCAFSFNFSKTTEKPQDLTFHFAKRADSERVSEYVVSYLDPAFELLLLGHFIIRDPFAPFSETAEKGRD